MARPGEKCRDVCGVEINPGAKVVVATWHGVGLRVGRVIKLEKMTTVDASRVWIDGDENFHWSDSVAVVGQPTVAEVGAASSAIREPAPIEHVTTVAAESRSWRAACTCGASFPSHQIMENARRKHAHDAKAAAQQDAVAHLREVRS